MLLGGIGAKKLLKGRSLLIVMEQMAAIMFLIEVLSAFFPSSSKSNGISKSGFQAASNRNKIIAQNCCLGLAVHLFALSADAQVKYSITRPVPIDHLQSYPFAINGLGVVAGVYYWHDASQHGFFYDGAMHDVTTFGATTEVMGVTNCGLIIGNINQGYSQSKYFADFTDYRKQISLLADYETAHAVNGAGDIVGTNGLGGFLYRNGNYTRIPVGSGYYAYPIAINNNDAVTGYRTLGTFLSDVDMRAFIYHSGQLVVLGLLGSNTSQTLPGSWGVALNDHEQIVGESSSNAGPYHGFFYSGGIMQDINAWISTPGHPYNGPSSAYGINNSAQIVGRIGSAVAYLFSGGHAYDLNTLIPANSGWTLQTATGINDAGQITGQGTYMGEMFVSYLLTPIK
jgi:probable HAF family extracellular repeat protein